jgi:FixJ family two-component response regulator
MSGLQLQEALRERSLSVSIVFLTAFADVPMAVRAMENGAFKFLEKPYNPQELLEVIHEAIQRSRRDFRRCAERESIQERYEGLTTREREVMALIVDGHTNKEVASDLGLSKKTVDKFRQRVMARMQAANLPDLVRMAVDLADAGCMC